MDVSRSFQCLIALILIFTIGCGEEAKEVAHVAKEPPTSCEATSLETQFIVLWKTGRVTVEHADSREDFIENFVKPNINLIEVTQNDQVITFNDQPLKVETKLTPDQPQDPFWGLDSVQAKVAWDKGVYGQGVIVAVIDTPTDIHHTFLKNQIAYNDGESGVDASGRDKSTNGIDDDGNGLIDDYAGWDFLNNRPIGESNIAYDHGTHVSGIIAADHEAVTEGGPEAYGVAPQAKILPLGFIGNGGVLSDAMKAMDYAVQRGAKIINASWGGKFCSAPLAEKISSLQTKGVLFVTAAGNSGQNIDKLFEYPASYNLPTQITVGAIGEFGHMASFSNFGDNTVHVFAPGNQITSTLAGGIVGPMSGTSMAAPFVSGVAALLMSAKPEATVLEIRQALFSSVITDTYYRNKTQGRVAVDGALAALGIQ